MPTHYKQKAVCKSITNTAMMENFDVISDEMYTQIWKFCNSVTSSS